MNGGAGRAISLPAMMGVMRPHSPPSRPSAWLGMSQFGVLLLVLAGVFAMHGLAATVGGMAHYGPAAVVATAGYDQLMPVPAPDPQDVSNLADRHPMSAIAPGLAPGAVGTAFAGSKGPAEDGGFHWLMAACVFVLCGLVLLLATRLMAAAWFGHRPVGSVRCGRSGEPPERPPPRPIYLSLCLLRL